MPRRPSLSRALPVVLGVTLSLAALTARAQQSPPAPAPAASPEAAPDVAARKEEGRRHFEKGIALYNEQAWAAALAEFLESRSLYPTRAATKNAALCMRKLQRFDEALDMFTALLREFPGLPAEDKAAAEREMSELRALVGAIDISGAEPGAAIVIGGRNRGDYPPLAPIRVPAGAHVVRVYKEGYIPFEARVDVAGGQTVELPAALRPLTRSGRLVVVEQSGKSVDVLVDNVVVGKTPWEGLLDVGSHTVLLRGAGSIGTQPAAARVVENQVTALTLAAEPLDAALRIEPMPVGATIALDFVNVGSGIWEGRLRPGKHRIDVTAEGFLPARSLVSVGREERRVVAIELQRDPASEFWRKPSRLAFEAVLGAALSPSFGGDLAGSCARGCSQAPGFGGLALAFAGYELPSGVSFGIAGGYLFAEQRTEARPTRIRPVGLPESAGATDDRLELSGFSIGPVVGLRLGERFPTTLRLHGGALLGSLRDRRIGAFTTRSGAAYTTGPLTHTAQVTYIHIDPEVRVAARISPHFEISAGITAMVLIALSEPRWDASIQTDASADGVGTYAPETLAGRLSVMLVPGLGARYDF